MAERRTDFLFRRFPFRERLACKQNANPPHRRRCLRRRERDAERNQAGAGSARTCPMTSNAAHVGCPHVAHEGLSWEVGERFPAACALSIPSACAAHELGLNQRVRGSVVLLRIEEILGRHESCVGARDRWEKALCGGRRRPGKRRKLLMRGHCSRFVHRPPILK